MATGPAHRSRRPEGLVSTGSRTVVGGTDWIEIDGGDEFGDVWIPTDRLVRIGDLLDGDEPAVVQVVGDGPVNLGLWPGRDAPIHGSAVPGDVFPRTGRRARVDGLEWAELGPGGGRPITWVAASFVTFVDGEGIEVPTGDG